MIKIIVIILSCNLLFTYAGYLSPCEIEGVEKSEWYHGKNLRQRVPDSQEGPFVQFSTKDIIGIRKQTSMYINATYKDNVLQLRPNFNFKYFEEDYKDEVTPVLDITITFNCVRNTSESIKFIARVEDVNNHAPIFSNDVYEYHFGMPIPEDYYLTDILPISVTDDDFTNHQIYFTMKYNTILRVLYNGRTKYDDDKYFTTLKTLTEIKAPFREEFIIRATDGGTPPKKSNARIVITVSSNSQNKTINPIFLKRAYVANYHHEYFQLEDSVKLGTSLNELHLKQYGFEEYFKFTETSNGILQVTNLKPIPEYLRKSNKIVVIDLEASNEHISDRTSLIIRLNTEEDLVANFIDLTDFYGSNLFSLLIYVSVFILIVTINLKVLHLYFNKHHQRFNTSLPL